MNSSRSFCAAVALGQNSILVAGGYDCHQNELNTPEVRDISNEKKKSALFEIVGPQRLYDAIYVRPIDELATLGMHGLAS